MTCHPWHQYVSACTLYDLSSGRKFLNFISRWDLRSTATECKGGIPADRAQCQDLMAIPQRLLMKIPPRIIK
jgi:hypothetical protein